jgi:outer membrane immunogenic protein
MMKKILTIAAIISAVAFSSSTVYGQAQKYLNVGGAGTGLYASIEFPVSSVITIAPQFSTDYNFNALVFAGKGNFYFDDIFELPGEWDVYAGINLGWRVESGNDGFNFGAQVGARWFWSDKWGVNAEFGGGSGVLGGIGLTLKM